MTEQLVLLKSKLRSTQKNIQDNRLAREEYWKRRMSIAEFFLTCFIILFASAFVNGWNWSRNIVIILGTIGFLGIYASYHYAKEANTTIEHERGFEMGYGTAVDAIE